VSAIFSVSAVLKIFLIKWMDDSGKEEAKTKLHRSPRLFCMTGVRRQKRRYNEALSIYYIVILFVIYRKEITLNDIIILDIIII